jgi:hypothetical protein
MIRWALLNFEPYVTDEMRYKATYFGVISFSVDKSIQLSGVPSTEIPENAKDVYEGIVKDYLKNDLSALKIPALEVLVVDINSVRPLGQSRSLEMVSWESRSLENVGIEIDTTIAGQYKPPPEADFENIVEESLKRGSREITEKLKESGNPYFENLAIIDVQEDDDEDSRGKSDEEDRTKRRSKSKVGIIFGVLFLILFLVAMVIAAIIFYRRRKEKESYEERKILDDNTVDPNDYGDFYSKEAHSIPSPPSDEYASVITDPTYRGGEYDDIDRAALKNASEYYEEDMFDEEDAGTFTGQSIIPDENDDISCLNSVKGCEDGWTTESSKRTLETNYETSDNYQSTDDQRFSDNGQSGYESHTSGHQSRHSGSFVSSASRHHSDSNSRSDNENDGYQSQGTGYVSAGHYSAEESSVNFMSVVSAPVVNRRNDALNAYSDSKTNVSAPTFFEGEERNMLLDKGPPNDAGSLESNGNGPSHMTAGKSQDVQQYSNTQISSSHSLNQDDYYDDAMETRSYTSAPTIVGKESQKRMGNADDFSMVSIDSIASAPTVMADRPPTRNSQENPYNTLTKIEEGNEYLDMADGASELKQGSSSRDNLYNKDAHDDAGAQSLPGMFSAHSQGDARLDAAQSVPGAYTYSAQERSQSGPRSTHSAQGGNIMRDNLYNDVQEDTGAQSVPDAYSAHSQGDARLDAAQSVPGAYTYSAQERSQSGLHSTHSAQGGNIMRDNLYNDVQEDTGAQSLPDTFIAHSQGDVRLDAAQSVPGAYTYSAQERSQSGHRSTHSAQGGSRSRDNVYNDVQEVEAAQSVPDAYSSHSQSHQSGNDLYNDVQEVEAQSVPAEYNAHGYDERSQSGRSTYSAHGEISSQDHNSYNDVPQPVPDVHNDQGYESQGDRSTHHSVHSQGRRQSDQDQDLYNDVQGVAQGYEMQGGPNAQGGTSLGDKSYNDVQVDSTGDQSRMNDAYSSYSQNRQSEDYDIYGGF